MLAEQDFLREYENLIREVDAALQGLAEQHVEQLRCRPGCCHCCSIQSVLPLEADNIRRATAVLSEDVKKVVRMQAGGQSCPFLVDRHCVIYSSRPLICRSHGLPIAYVDYDRQAIEVSACPENFPDDFSFDQQDLFFIDTFNSRLAQLNGDYCSERSIAADHRIDMDSLARGDNVS